MNERRIGWILKTMGGDRRMRNAPVYMFESTAKNPYQILVSTMLSARTKDRTTVQVTRKLFANVKKPEDILAMDKRKLEKALYGVGFYRVKARHLKGMARILVAESGSGKSRIPDTLEGLLGLPGVGRKTANIVLARAFGKRTLGVDVHVHRISNRLGLVRTKKPEDTEKRLMKTVPGKDIRRLNRIFVAYGQTVCLPRNPLCPECRLRFICPKRGVPKDSWSPVRP